MPGTVYRRIDCRLKFAQPARATVGGALNASRQARLSDSSYYLLGKKPTPMAGLGQVQI